MFLKTKTNYKRYKIKQLTLLKAWAGTNIKQMYLFSLMCVNVDNRVKQLRLNHCFTRSSIIHMLLTCKITLLKITTITNSIEDQAITFTMQHTNFSRTNQKP